MPHQYQPELSVRNAAQSHLYGETLSCPHIIHQSTILHSLHYILFHYITFFTQPTGIKGADRGSPLLGECMCRERIERSSTHL